MSKSQKEATGLAPARKSYLKMSIAELREATRQYDAPDPDPVSLPVPPSLKARDARVVAEIRERASKARRGRPIQGQGAERVLITVERGLLAEADSFAARNGKSRSELIADGLRLAMKRGKGKRRKSA